MREKRCKICGATMWTDEPDRDICEVCEDERKESEEEDGTGKDI
jgi:rubredoxin